MKHLIWILLITIVLSFVFGSIHEESYKDNPDYTYNEVTKTEPKVYVTNSGSFYHNVSCGYLYKSSIAKGRGQAYEAGYSACSRCGGKPSGTITVTYKVNLPRNLIISSSKSKKSDIVRSNTPSDLIEDFENIQSLGCLVKKKKVLSQ